MAKQTGQIPKALAEKPKLHEHLRFVWSAFAALNTDRQFGMATGPIMFSSIERYARRYGIEGVDAFDRFATLIRAMDREFLASPTQPKD